MLKGSLMRAVLCTEFGPPEKLVIKDIPVPKPSQKQVRIKIEACGVNFPDTLIIENKYQYKPDLPFSPGGEVAGIIDELGDGVTNYSIGEKVMAMTLFGGFSDYIVYDGWELKGWPVKTIVRGQIIAEDFQVIGKPGYGKLVPRKINST